MMTTHVKIAYISWTRSATMWHFKVEYSNDRKTYFSNVPFEPYYEGQTFDKALQGIKDALRELDYEVKYLPVIK